MSKKSKVIQTRGKRKTSVARASLKPGKGKITINGQYLENFSNEMSRLRILEPLLFRF